jgi:hypothetical protein
MAIPPPITYVDRHDDTAISTPHRSLDGSIKARTPFGLIIRF